MFRPAETHAELDTGFEFYGSSLQSILRFRPNSECLLRADKEAKSLSIPAFYMFFSELSFFFVSGGVRLSAHASYDCVSVGCCRRVYLLKSGLGASQHAMHHGRDDVWWVVA